MGDEAKDILAKKIFINKRVHPSPRVEKSSISQNKDEKKSGNSIFFAIVVLVLAILTLQYLSGMTENSDSNLLFFYYYFIIDLLRILRL